ncbi:CPCC family cysteine-rich protein [Gottfriedia acidiceleris]|uniref:CPCC family cysteine-rich protein n=1 Tax=Gottfriedia acidiceleris TaxID=371036 RepID=UPI0013EA7E2C|nr:CPCC family cysteine-rich protein [Gottfriedia acidiceleris]
MKREICPCCGYPTLEERDKCDICMLCHWEDLPFGENFEDVDPNNDSYIAESRRNFNKYYIMYSEKRILDMQTPQKIEAKKALISAYEELKKGNSDPVTYRKLWRKAKCCEYNLMREKGYLDGIVFCVAKTFKEVPKSDEYINLGDNAHYFLMNKEGFFSRDLTKNSIQVDMLLFLNDRGKKKFNTQEINELIHICETLVNMYTKNTREEQEIKEFAEDLKDLSQNALSMGKFVIAVGTKSNLFH